MLLHGSPLSGRTWDGVVAALRDRFTGYAPDLIGLGESRSAADRDHASEGQARALAGLLSHLGVASHALLGNDTGGWVARELAPPWIPTYQALAHVPGFGALLRRMLRSDALVRSSLVFGGCFHDPAHLAGEFHRRVVEPLATSRDRVEGALRFLRCMKFERLDAFHERHRALATPTLFVWGADDPTFPVARAREMSRRFSRLAGFHEVADAKLFFHEERPEALAHRIAAFLSGAST